MERLETGVYALNSTQATIAGNYTLSVGGVSSVNIEGKRTFAVVPDSALRADFTITTSGMTSSGARVTIRISYFDAYNNRTHFDGMITAVNQQIVSTATTSASLQPSGVYLARMSVLDPGVYTLSVTSATTGDSLTTSGRAWFNINPGIARRAVFHNVTSSVLVGESLGAVAVRFFDGLQAPTNYWYGRSFIDGPERMEINLGLRDEFLELHSGWFDVDSATALFSVGQYAFVVYDTASPGVPLTELRMSGRRNFTVRALPQRAFLSFALAGEDTLAARAGTNVGLTVRFRDTLGNIADILEPVRIVASTAGSLDFASNALIARRLQRSVVGGEPLFSTQFTPSTAGNYVFRLDSLLQDSLQPRIQGRNSLLVRPDFPRTAHLTLSTTALLMSDDELCVEVRLFDRFGNRAEALPDRNGSLLSFQYSSGAISSIGTIALFQEQQRANGEYLLCDLRFAQANLNDNHRYTISLNGITAANTNGARQFQVMNPLPALYNINPPSFIIEDCGSTFTFLALDKGANTTSADNASQQEQSQPALLPTPGQRRQATEEPTSFRFYPNAPNPFRDATTFFYDLWQDGRVSLTVKDMNGAIVAKVLDLQQSAGSYEIQWTPPLSLPSASYIVHLLFRTADGKTEQRTLKAQRVK